MKLLLSALLIAAVASPAKANEIDALLQRIFHGPGPHVVPYESEDGRPSSVRDHRVSDTVVCTETTVTRDGVVIERTISCIG
jgi:hypothetical protein